MSIGGIGFFTLTIDKSGHLRRSFKPAQVGITAF
jgi:hypothetical protein